MARYDPDSSPDDFDPTDLEMGDGYLDHPNTIAMHETLGEQFRASPPANQVEEVARLLADAMRRRDELAGLLAGTPDNDPRRRLHDHLTATIRAAVARIASLSEQPPAG